MRRKSHRQLEFHRARLDTFTGYSTAVLTGCHGYAGPPIS
jgi:hypothetical protein